MTTPIAIIVAGVIIAAAIIFGPQNNAPAQVAAPLGAMDAPAAQEEGGVFPDLAIDVRKTDHILGNPDADVFIVEYSDIDCPFCGRLHPTLEDLVEERDDVAWIYRHFPLENLHPEAKDKAVMTECVAKHAGEDAFWDYLAGLITGSDVMTYADYGVTADQIAACEEDEDILAKVAEDMALAVASGGTGTPHSVVSNEIGGFAVSGALPAEVWDEAIELLRTETESEG